ncbi:MAG: MmgE/PrpD family protein [Lachnospiraceae bacterium]|nr:MmgE/PrpD family protein [Lachnospiraceae bacterium]
MNVSRALADFVVNTGYEDIPSHVIDVEKRSILDNIAIISGGADGDGCREFVEFAEEASAGGRGEATVLGYNKKLPALWAAFANAAMVMSLDFADTSATATIHPNTSTFPVCLALSEKLGNVSGKEFLAAMVLGSEVACRLACAASPARFAMYGFYMPPVITSFGATAAACKLLGLNADRVIDAWSINLSQYTCSSELTKNKETPIRSIRESFGAKSAMSSAILAGKGIKGFKDPFEGQQGFYTAYFQGDYDKDAILKNLGKDYEAAKLIFKPWPCCMGNHGCINAALNIMKDNKIKPEDITAVKAEVPTVARAVLEPSEDKKRPQNAIGAKYSIPFTVSTAIIDGNVTLGSFSPESLQREDILSLASKFSHTLNDEWEKDKDMKTGGRLTIETKDGRSFVDTVSKTLGNPENPMSDEAFNAKFYSCMDKAFAPKTHEEQTKVLDAVRNLEKVSDIRQLAKLL